MKSAPAALPTAQGRDSRNTYQQEKADRPRLAHPAEHDPIMGRDEVLTHASSLMSLKSFCKVKETSHTRPHVPTEHPESVTPPRQRPGWGLPETGREENRGGTAAGADFLWGQ